MFYNYMLGWPASADGGGGCRMKLPAASHQSRMAMRRMLLIRMVYAEESCRFLFTCETMNH